jgi:hypothetical protein
VQELENETEDLEDKLSALELLVKLKARRNQLESEVAKHTKDNVPAEDSTPTKEN